MLIAAAAALIFLGVRSAGLLSFLSSTPSALGEQTVLALGRHAFDLLVCAASLAGIATAGRRALGTMGLLTRETEPWKRWAYGLVAGEVALSFVLWLLLAAGALQPWICAVLAAALAGVAFHDRAELAKLRFPGPRGALEIACLAVILAVLLSGAATAGAPPTDWDSLTHYLALPRLFLEKGAYFRLPWSASAHYPLSAEMFYAWAMSLSGETAAQWLAWLHGPLLLGLAAGWASSLGGRSAGWLAAALLCATPAFTRVLGTGKNDLAAAFACAAVAAAALDAWKRGWDRDWLLAGLLGGAAASVKLTGLWALAGAGALALARAVAKKELKPPILLAAAALPLGAPWYARNLVWTGNPIWPLLGYGAAPAASAYERLRAAGAGGVPRTVSDFLLLPIWLLASPQNFPHPPRELLGAGVLACFAVKRPAAPPAAAAFAAVYLGCWFFVSQDGRFLLPVSLLLACGAAVVASRAEAAPWRRAAAWAALAVGLAPALTVSPNGALFGFLSLSREHAAADARSRYLEHALGAPYAGARGTASLPAEAKVLLYRDARGYFLEREYAVENALDPGVVSWVDVEGPEDLLSRLREQGYTHVLHDTSLPLPQGDQDYYARADKLMQEMLLAHGKPLRSSGPVSLYELP